MKAVKERKQLTQVERNMSDVAWNGYMAGKYAQQRDRLMLDARASTDTDLRAWRVTQARARHRDYLKHARAAH